MKRKKTEELLKFTIHFSKDIEQTNFLRTQKFPKQALNRFKYTFGNFRED